MAEETNATTAAEATKVNEDSTRATDTSVAAAVSGETPGASEKVAGADNAVEGTKLSTESNDAAASEETATVPAPSADTAAANGTPASSKKTDIIRRKSTGGGKKTPSKKKVAPELHLDIEPGQVWFVTMRGYPAWPVVVCDEEMLPETLLSKRPVSAKRIDGTYREDYQDSGKNAKDRRYPIMFLASNEFSWQPNTDFQPLDLDQVKAEVAAGKQGKKKQQLWEAYQIAAENHDLEYFKEMLKQHEQAIVEDAQAADAKEKDKKAKQEKRKSKGSAAADDEDVDMEDADDTAASGKKKGSKKRKKEPESDGENGKPQKTPKTKLKLNNKTPKDGSTSKAKKESKPKKTKARSESEEAEPIKVEEPPMTEERAEKRKKSVLYLRHRLQKGFLARDQAPKEEEMTNMAEYFKQLEAYQDLEADIIRETKVHKVLKAIIKLESIPKEEEYKFKERSTGLLATWNRALSAAEGETPTTAEAPSAPTTNGVNHESKNEKTEANGAVEEHSKATPAEAEIPKKTDTSGDVSMTDAKEVAPVAAEESRKTEAAPTTTEATTEAGA